MTVPNKTSNPRRNNLFDVEWANTSEVYSSDLHWQKAGQSPQLEQNESQLKAFVTRHISPVSWTLNLSKAANVSCTLNNFQNTSDGLSGTNHLVRQPLWESRLLIPAGKTHPPLVHVKETPSYGTFYFSFPAALLALAEWAQQPWISGRDSLLKRSEKRLKGRESLQPGMEPETMWKSWMEIQWDPAHCSKRGGSTGRKSWKKKNLTAIWAES